MINFRRIIRAGFIGFWRSGYVSVASVFILTAALFALGSLMLGSAFLNSTLDNIESQVDISVSFVPEASESQVRALQSSLELLPEVRQVTYSSREDELRNFLDRHQDNSLLIQSINEVGNPFGARLNILAVDASQYEVISRYLENHDETVGGESVIDQISFKKDVIEKLLGLTATSRTVGLTISLVMIVLGILVTFTTISLAIYISREEISVMRLVGANNSYIRGPFIIQGMIAGVIASFLAIAVLYPSVIWVRSVTVSYYGGINLVSYFVDNFAIIFLTLFVSGIALGALSSFLAVRKYLRV